MRISVLSKLAESIDLCIQLQEEGNDVTLYTLTPGEANVGEGIVPIKTHLGGLNADLIINDDVFLGSTSDKLRAAGKVVVGGSVITDRLENDREFGIDIMHACGIKVPTSSTFNNFRKGIEFIKNNQNKRYVFKPHGQKDRFFTHIAKNAEEMVAMMEHYQTIWEEEAIFDLQEFVDGIEMAIGGWFNGNKFCKQVMPNFEHKRLMNGEIGPNTGEMGSVMAYRTHSKLYQETLAKAEAFLRTTGYRGFIDVACIVNKDRAYGLEWTARFGYPTISIQDEVHKKGTWTKFLYELAKGTAETVPVDTSKWAVGVAYCALPWPQKEENKIFQGTPLFFPKDLDHIHFRDVRLDGEQYRQAGLMGYICLCTGSDITIEKAKKKAYKVIDTVHVPGGFYRMDIGDKIINNMPVLRNLGWLR